MKRSIFFAVIITFLLALPAYAQNDNGIASPLVDLINQLGELVTALILAAMAEATTWLTGWVRTWKWLGATDQKKVSGLLANLTGAVSALIVTSIAIGVSMLIGLVGSLDAQSFVLLLGTIGGATWGGSSAVMHKIHKAVG